MKTGNDITALLLIALLAVAPAALAATEEPGWLQRCGDGSQQQMNACMAEEYRTADARLNTVYSKLVATLQDPAKLKRAQRTWLRFRDLSCDYETSGMERDASLYPFSLAACRIGVTEERIAELEHYLAQDCPGCPPRKQTVLP